MTHASVFSGIGGPEIAAQMLGWDNVFHCEVDSFCNKILDYWFPNAKSYKDVRQTDFREWRGKIDVLSGGFPCQPFSAAGKRKGANDDRYLWPEMLRCIDEIRPTWVVGENVVGITSMVQSARIVELENQTSLFEEDNRLYRHRYVGIFTLERICKDLESLRYEVQPVIIPACAVGAPHRRDRVFILGRQRAVTDTESWRAGDLRIESEEDGTQMCDKVFGNACRLYLPTNEAGLRRWANFPTVSPVHRGNDGIPFDVDRLAISFVEWRTKSLKAYGNAIVPQVIYEIFKNIDIIENER